MSASSSRGLRGILLNLSIVLTAACTLLDLPFPYGSSRASEEHSPADTYSPAGPKRTDTLLLASALCFPVSYDWQRDTAYGNVSCTLRLFRGDEPILSVPAGPGTLVSNSPDGHHIIDGSLYTVYSDSQGTYIGRDSVQIAKWPEKELIIGILPFNDRLFTLGIDGGSGDICYRCDGKVAWSGAGTPFGGFCADTYGPTGALYEDSGAVCFSYKHTMDSSVEVGFLADGQAAGRADVALPAAVQDAKRIGGRCAVLYSNAGRNYILEDGGQRCINPGGGVCWTDAGLVEYGGTISVSGRCRINAGGGYRWGVGNEHTLLRLPGHPDYVYMEGDEIVPLELGTLGNCMFLNRGCACLSGGRLAVALTPKDGSGSPYVQYGSRRVEYGINGFLTGVSCQTSAR